jgi:hypothetical protein
VEVWEREWSYLGLILFRGNILAFNSFNLKFAASLTSVIIEETSNHLPAKKR